MGSKNRLYMDIMSLHNEVTGSCNLCVLKLPNGETKRFIVDCGLFQECEYTDLNSELLFTPGNIEFALITHNHVDHIGKLPYITRKGFSGKIYATNTTCNFMPYALYDSYKVLKDIAKRNHTSPLYNERDVANAIGLLTPCDYNKTIEIDENIRVTFFSNGHLVGAAMILVQISYLDCEDINILFTGDYNNKNIFFDVHKLPDWVLELPLTVVQESTYGNMESTEIEKCFQKNILNCVENGGTVVSMVFSLGRAQEILYELKCMQKAKALSTDIPIYLDGKLALRYTELYLKGAAEEIKDEMRDFLPENLTFVDTPLRESLLCDKQVKIILTTSGMGSYGPAQVYIPEYITRAKALIHFTGFTPEYTLGGKLKSSDNGEIVNIGSLLVKKRANVEYTKEYSAHAKADEMIEFLKSFKNLKFVLVNHGETETKEIFASRILDEVETKQVGILSRTYLFRITPYGFEKTMPTKFM